MAAILPASSAPPMIITGNVAAAKMAVSPITEYHAAIAEMSTAIVRITNPNIIVVYLPTEFYSNSLLDYLEECKRFGNTKLIFSLW